ncbi:MAG: PIN domain-containing protein [Nitrospirae bacterium]|nr:PIN domain-containing protein [Nitrospirota bacterium]
MDALVVDTSVWIEFFKGRTFTALETALAESRVVLAPIVVAELLSGRLSLARRRSIEDFLIELPLHETPLFHWASVGSLRARLAENGIAVSAPDAHVAQCTLEVNGALLTLDRVFDRVASRTPLKLLRVAD